MKRFLEGLLTAIETFLVVAMIVFLLFINRPAFADGIQICNSGVVKAGDPFANCAAASVVCNIPHKPTDLLRVKVGTAQQWQPWTAITTTSMLFDCTSQTFIKQSTLNIPAPYTAAFLQWTPPTKNQDGSALTDLASYVIQYGMDITFDKVQAVPSATASNAIVRGITKGTWSFRILAVNTSGGMSDPSNSRVLTARFTGPTQGSVQDAGTTRVVPPTK